MNWMKLLLVILGFVSGAYDAWAIDSLDPAEVTPGQTGLCVTEMDGGERVEIPLTVLGTVGSGRPYGEIVLVRLDHQRMRDTGIIACMSGSPACGI